MKKPSGFKQSYDLAWSDHQRQMEIYEKERGHLFRYIVWGNCSVMAMGGSPRCDR